MNTVTEIAPVITAANDALKRDLLMTLRSRFGSDRTGRGFAWLYDYDAGSPDVLAGSMP